MPCKDNEKRNARNREKYAQRKAEDPDYIAKRAAQQSAWFQKKKAEDESFEAKRKADFAKWYAEHGKENARERKGYKPLEEYLAECKANRQTRAEYMREWIKTETGRRWKVAQSIKKRCGLTIDEYDRVYDQQKGKCRICGVQKERYAKDRLVVDHCHQTGKFRALLCGKCNCAIGMLGKDEQILQNAIAYLLSVREAKTELQE